MKTFKDRYRRVPIALPLSPKYEGLSSDAKLALLTLIISPRQTQAGVFDGTHRALEYETGLNGKRLGVALAELDKAEMIEVIPTGGWWIKDTYGWQVSNEGYESAAIKQLSERWPDLLPKFQQHNAAILGRKDKPPKTTDPPGTPPDTPLRGHTEAVTGLQNTDNRVQGSDPGNGSGVDETPALAVELNKYEKELLDSLRLEVLEGKKTQEEAKHILRMDGITEQLDYLLTAGRKGKD
jgi:hypothetical protein